MLAFAFNLLRPVFLAAVASYHGLLQEKLARNPRSIEMD